MLWPPGVKVSGTSACRRASSCQKNLALIMSLVILPGAEPEPRNDRASRQFLDLVKRRILPRQPAVPAKRADRPDRVRKLVVERPQVAAEQTGEPVTLPEPQGHVGGAETALGITCHS